jgi:hypothetical protein
MKQPSASGAPPLRARHRPGDRNAAMMAKLI